MIVRLVFVADSYKLVELREDFRDDFCGGFSTAEFFFDFFVEYSFWHLC